MLWRLPGSWDMGVSLHLTKQSYRPKTHGEVELSKVASAVVVRP